ncbi:MAG: type II secretion system F family protein, partial [Pirellulaceae bacterium]|nr:type II secretion system F family protein [Pirellulaceae bacterium]
MPEFAYKARDMSGDRVTGVISAASEREAISLLSGKSLFPLDVSPEKEAAGFSFGGRVSGQLMAMTYSQLGALLNSGVPLLRSLAVLRDQSSNKTLTEVLTDIHRRVEDGATLADAMQRHPRCFNEMAVNMVRAGGEGGFLEEALERVATFTEQYEDLKAQTAGALAYPIFLGVVGTSVVAVLIIFFVPKFASLFDRLRQRGELPAMTEWLLFISDTIRSYGWIFLIVAAIVAIFLRAQLASESGKRMADLIKLRVPGLGVIFTHLA